MVVQSCGDPGTPVHGEKTGLDYIYGKIVTFKCNGIRLEDVKQMENGVVFNLNVNVSMSKL